jgi:hypothetical protein
MLNFLANNPGLLCCFGIVFWGGSMYGTFLMGKHGSPVKWVGFKSAQPLDEI